MGRFNEPRRSVRCLRDPRRAPYPEYFTSKHSGNHYRLTCKDCGEKFTIAKPDFGNDFAAREQLTLVNHALTHRAGGEAR